MRKQELLSLLVLLGACTSGPTREDPDDWSYRRDTARIEAEERFEERKAKCARSRGVVVVNRQFSRRIRRAPGDIELATCAPGRGGLTF